MNSRARSTALIMLFAVVFSLIPAAGVAQPASALAACDWAQFVSDVTIPDGTYFTPGATFSKTWRLKNIGTCTWTTGYQLVFDSGSQMGGASSYSMPTTVAPGSTVDITINLTAPTTAGHYIGYWKLKNASGVIFGIGTTANKSFWVEINVSSSTSGSGSGYDFTANAPSASWRTGAGAITYNANEGSANGFAVRRDQPVFEGNYQPGQPGMLFVPNAVTNGYVQGTYPAFRVQNGDRFQARIGCENNSTGCFVAYRLDYQIGSGPVRTFWSFLEKIEGLTYPVDLNLNSLAGYDVTFTLVVSAYGSPSGDRAMWGNPIIYRVGGTPPPPPPSGKSYDFGTATSPVASGYTRVTEATVYASGGFGWTDTSALTSRDRGAPADALLQDFVVNDTSGARTFKVDLANGTYNVTTVSGDHDYAHDNLVVKANGTTVLGDVDSAAGSFTSNTFSVTVTGGSLSLEFSDAGGSDPSWVINAVTITPTGVATPTQQSSCTDRVKFVRDTNYPDGTVVSPGTAFTKTWTLQNVGTCTWSTGYSLIFESGAQMSGPASLAMPSTVSPGSNVDVSVNLVAPTTAGTYRGYWKFKNAAGTAFGIGSSYTQAWWVEIKVNTSVTNTPGTPSTPATSVPGTTFDFVTRMCDAVWFSGAGQLPCPGTDGDSRGFALKLTSPHLENGTTDSRPGLLTFPQNVYNGYIQGIYPPYTVQPGDRFRTNVGCESGSNCYVVFRLDYQIGTGPIHSNCTDAGTWCGVEQNEGLVYPADVSLAPLVGQSVKFILTVLSAGPTTNDRALWGSPMIYNGTGASTATVPVTTTVTSTPTKTATTGPSPTFTQTQTPTSTPTATNTVPAPTSYKLDFGPASSPVQSGYTAVSEATAFTSGGFGWLDVSALSSRDRGGPDALHQDFVMNDTSGARTFKMAIANGTYTVTLSMGDNDYAHDNMVVKANTVTQNGDVDSAAGAFTTVTFPLTVTDGQISIEISDAGGTDPTWVINSIDVVAGS